jgi:hypothetical protein
MKIFPIITAIVLGVFSIAIQALQPADVSEKNQNSYEREKTFIINALTLIAEKNELLVSSNARLQLDKYKKLKNAIEIDEYQNAYRNGVLTFSIPGKSGKDGLIKATFTDINQVINGQITLIKFSDSSGNFLGTIFGNSINVSPSLLKNQQTPPKNSNDASSYDDQSYLYPSQYEGAKGAAIGAGAGF